MNHFLKSSFIIPNNDIKIITIAIKHRTTPKIINILLFFNCPKWIENGPNKIGIKEAIKIFIPFEIFLFSI